MKPLPRLTTFWLHANAFAAAACLAVVVLGGNPWLLVGAAGNVGVGLLLSRE
jgi:hypothetical protein